ncbi:FMN-dependent alpha-hydroxy acid dehydrogenase [Gloeophyllum trabeum ATCC 11539]|uniref:FMN-dependent alpha-hydroxy acid dehydrogenase n=1 Tax=Gloeophyllum trabeum (strain ATCC 11539 / FP-39264 / Madison 617) TaxID=670483 RepID=S7RKC2_GLOTA|nr:FMN-dependent alpha-hydroxy acid dehydrogenase [Gloeophyllum trabeum ATCC 11539]EPQ54840.1 FMN-dependent alpha-hydroxy acid dehydrogenase [Gloeophyllum trabeum ATCC 11539]
MMEHSVQTQWSKYVQDLYNARGPPVLKSLNIDELEKNFIETLKDSPEAWTYVVAGAGTGSTTKANRDAFEKWRILPRMLRDAGNRNLETIILGKKQRSPVMVGPVGAHGLVHKDAELATASAAARVGVTFCLSSPSTRSMEEVAKANGDGERWFQLYWRVLPQMFLPKSQDITKSLLKRAKANGFTALIVTLDTMVLGWRIHDIEKLYSPASHGVGVQNALSDPVFMARYGLQPIYGDWPDFPFNQPKINEAIANGDEKLKQRVMLAKDWVQEIGGEFKTWDHLKLLRENWDGPIVLKGIQHVADAEQAVDMGIEGIIVSSHGGRQIDGAVPSLYCLDKICSSPKVKAAQQSGQFTVLFDSGIRTGSDVIKAVALGAQGVLIGRLMMYALGIAGEAGVEQILRSLLADTEVTMGLAGYKSLGEIQGKRDEILVKWD